jgi:8-amino-7-oxononanoate synthase
MTMTWLEEIESELLSLEKAERFRSLSAIHGIDFISNDYLSLNHNGIIHQLFHEIKNQDNIQGAGGSRLLGGHHESFELAEQTFSNHVKFPAALLFNNGYAANTGTISACIHKHDTIYMDKLCHASMIDGVVLSGSSLVRYHHNDMDDLRHKLKKHQSGRKWILTESVFSMDGDQAPLKELCQIAREENAQVYVDEAHAYGIYGDHGAGLIDALKLQDQVTIAVYPCGKAPAWSGAFVAGDSNLKKYLINKSRSFIFSTAQPPVLAGTLNNIILFLQSETASNLRTKLFENSRLLTNLLGISDSGQSSAIIPWMTGSDKNTMAMKDHLLQSGISTGAARPPTVPPGKGRLRLIVKSHHTSEQLKQLANEILNYKAV